MPTYKLTYFDFRARGELCRLIFHVAGVEYEDERIIRAEWSKWKPLSPYGKLPYLTVDGKVLCQSITIARFLAKEFGLAGKTAWETARADMVVDAVSDMVNALAPSLIREPDEDKQNLRRREYEQNELPTHMQNLQKMLVENGTEYFAGDEMTWADLWVMHGIQWLENKRFNIDVPRKDYPQMDAFLSRMENSSKLNDYLASRPPAVI